MGKERPKSRVRERHLCAPCPGAAASELREEKWSSLFGKQSL